MALTEITVAQPAKDAETIAVYAHDGWQSVVAVIPCVHLRQHFRRAEMTSAQAALLVRSNIDSISLLMQDKYASGVFTTSNTEVPTAPRVIYFNLDDIKRANPSLSDRVLDLPSGWVSGDGKW
jgi:hypothetical protein